MKVVLVLRACEDVSPANVKNCAGLTLVLAFFLNLNSCQGTTCLGGEVTKNDDGDITLYAKNIHPDRVASRGSRMDQSTRRKPRPGLKTSAEAFFTTTASTATQRENPAASSSTTKSSGWKDRLKERCLNHVHRERGRLIQELRGLTSPPPRSLSSHVPSEPSPSSTLSPSLALLRPSESSSPSLCLNPSLMGSTVMSILQSEMRVVRMSCEERQAHGADGKLNDDGINGFRHGENEDQSFEPRNPPRPIFASSQGHATPPSGSWLKEGGAPISRSVAIEEDRATTEYEAGGLEDLSEKEQLELMRCIEEALEAEVMAADAEALEEYSQLESSDIEASVQALYDCHTLSHDDIAVLCPCCKSNFLLNHNEDIACACGLRLDVGGKAGKMTWLQARLADVYAQHRAICVLQEPVFIQREPPGLWVECGSCGLRDHIL